MYCTTWLKKCRKCQFKMKLKTTDISKINRRICEKKRCSNKSYGIAKAKFLCEMHYREIVPKKEKEVLGRGIL